MRIPASEVQKNFDKLIEKIEEEDVIITANGKEIARLIKYIDEGEKHDDSFIKEETSEIEYCIDGRTGVSGV